MENLFFNTIPIFGLFWRLYATIATLYLILNNQQAHFNRKWSGCKVPRASRPLLLRGLATKPTGTRVYYNCIMIELNIPGTGLVQLEHLVSDVNGTLAIDGKLIEGVARSLGSLQDRLTIHLITADTFGRQAAIDQQLNLRAVRLKPGNEAEQKTAYVESLTAARVAAIGQGANDALMLRAARVGICVLSLEGAAAPTLLTADVVVPNILAALGLFENPLRLVATMRK